MIAKGVNKEKTWLKNSIPTVVSPQTFKRQSHLFSQDQQEAALFHVLFAETLLTCGGWRLWKVASEADLT